jgi:hypothetical protein
VAIFGHSTGAKLVFSPRRPAAHALVGWLNPIQSVSRKKDKNYDKK